jgi:hypothetical protein
MSAAKRARVPEGLPLEDRVEHIENMEISHSQVSAEVADSGQPTRARAFGLIGEGSPVAAGGDAGVASAGPGDPTYFKVADEDSDDDDEEDTEERAMLEERASCARAQLMHTSAQSGDEETIVDDAAEIGVQLSISAAGVMAGGGVFTEVSFGAARPHGRADSPYPNYGTTLSELDNNDAVPRSERDGDKPEGAEADDGRMMRHDELYSLDGPARSSYPALATHSPYKPVRAFGHVLSLEGAEPDSPAANHAISWAATVAAGGVSTPATGSKMDGLASQQSAVGSNAQRSGAGTERQTNAPTVQHGTVVKQIESVKEYALMRNSGGQRTAGALGEAAAAKVNALFGGTVRGLTVRASALKLGGSKPDGGKGSGPPAKFDPKKFKPSGLASYERVGWENIKDDFDVEELNGQLIRIPSTHDECEAFFVFPRDCRAVDSVIREIYEVAAEHGFAAMQDEDQELEMHDPYLRFDEYTERLKANGECFKGAAMITSLRTPEELDALYRKAFSECLANNESVEKFVFRPSDRGMTGPVLTEHGRAVLGIKPPGVALLDAEMIMAWEPLSLVNEVVETFAGSVFEYHHFFPKGDGEAAVRSLLGAEVRKIQPVGKELKGTGVSKLLLSVPVSKMWLVKHRLKNCYASSHLEPALAKIDRGDYAVQEVPMVLAGIDSVAVQAVM